MLARWWHAAIAVLVFGAVVAQLAIAVRVSATPPDVTAGVLRGSTTAGRIIRVLSFFTIRWLTGGCRRPRGPRRLAARPAP
jgi:hypothetical protein